MQFEVNFTHEDGPLYYKDSSRIGLHGLAKIKDVYPEATTEDVRPYIHEFVRQRLQVTIPEPTAFASQQFRDDCEIAVAVTGEEYPLNIFLHLVVDQSSPRMRWSLDEDALIQAWMRAGAPLEWNANEECWGMDAETKYLNEQTVRKLQDSEPADGLLAEADAFLLEGQYLYVKTLVERLAQDGSTDLWTDQIGFHALRQIDAIDTRIEKIKFLKRMVCCNRSELRETRDAIDTRTHWLKSQKVAPWKLAILDALREANACAPALTEVSDRLGEVDNDVLLEDVPLTERVKDTIRGYDHWLNGHRSIIELLPPSWRQYCYRP